MVRVQKLIEWSFFDTWPWGKKCTMYTWVVSNFIINVLGLQDQIWTIFFQPSTSWGTTGFPPPPVYKVTKTELKRHKFHNSFLHSVSIFRWMMKDDKKKLQRSKYFSSVGRSDYGPPRLSVKKININPVFPGITKKAGSDLFLFINPGQLEKRLCPPFNR